MHATPQVIDVLLVEDDPGDVLMTREAFEDNKVANRLAVVSDGVSAMEYLRKEGEYADAPTPDLILLDLRMPDLDGLEVTRRLKAHPATASVPVLALTALSDEDDRRAAIDAGCVGCITKPFNNEELASAIADALDRTPAGGQR